MAIDHYENFPVASFLLPQRLRRAVQDVYRFARSADDLADEGNASDSERMAQLGDYRRELHRIGATPAIAKPGIAELSHIFDPLGQTIRQFQLPITPFFDLLSAFEQDVGQNRYAHFADLEDYCRRSAQPVGRIMLYLYGTTSPRDIARSDAICTALQLVNMWQDVQIDWRRGRLYLPQEDLDRFGIMHDDLHARKISPQWRAFMAFEFDRTQALLNFGAPLARDLPGRIGFELRLVVEGARQILRRIEANDYDVFMNRPQLGKSDWAAMLWRATFLYDT